MAMTWDEAVAFALTLPGVALSTSYGQPAVKVREEASDTKFVIPVQAGIHVHVHERRHMLMER